MDNVIIYLKDNWKLILEVAFLVVSVVFFIVRKRSFVYDNSNQLYCRIIELILEAEKKWPNGHGKEKLRYVVDAIIEEKCGGNHFAALEQYIENIVEDILYTPKKKGENYGKKN